MRMRKKKHGEERLLACGEFVIDKPDFSAICQKTPVWLAE